MDIWDFAFIAKEKFNGLPLTNNKKVTKKNKKIAQSA